MSGGSKKKSGSKKAKADAAANDSTNSNSLARPPNNRSINPRGILTGYYQKNGKRVQHTVQDGALQMPKDSLDVIAKATGNYSNQESNYKLPGLDSVVRPCLDPKLETIVVTELVMEKVQIPQEQPVPPVPSTFPGVPPFQPPPIIKMVKTSRPSATNKRIRRVPTNPAGAERIRGGGDAQPPNQQTPTPTPPVASAPVAQAPVVPAASATNDVVMAPAPATSAVNPTAAPIAAQSSAPGPIAAAASVAPAPVVQPPAVAASNAPTPSTVSAAPAPVTNPPPAAASVPSVGLTQPAPSLSAGVPTQQQPTPAAAPVATPAVAAPAAPTPAAPAQALSSVGAPIAAKSPAVTGTSTQATPAPVAPVQTAPVAPVAKPIEVVAKPVAPPVAPAAAVAPTATTAISKETPTVKTETSAPASATTSSTAPPAPVIPVVASSTPAVKPATPQVKVEEKKPEEKVPEAKPLQSKPTPQWDQHKPGPNDETITPANQLPPKPKWYKKDGINEIERTMLPEWFDSSSSHRTPESYVKTREKIIEMSETLSNRNVTNAMIRRTILGDAGSLQRLRSFLVNWGIINRDGINDSAPTTASLRPDLKRSAKFTNDMRDTLILAVTEQASKKRKLLASPTSPSPSLALDWEEIASKVGSGVTAERCRETFMTAPLKEETSTAMDVTDGSSPSSEGSSRSQEELIQTLVGSSNPEVVKKVCDAAMEASGFDSVGTRAASLLGLQLTQSLENARGHEVDLAVRLSKLLDARMQKLENRMAMMDDVEGILEAEKLALEMERRDLYTARCRHWFGGV